MSHTQDPSEPHDTPDAPTQSKTGIIRWRCPNCGQTLFTARDDDPPDLCDYCDDMTTWQRVAAEPD